MKKVIFSCPNHGWLKREEVDFLCNHCPNTEVVQVDGTYWCPSCLVRDAVFRCRRCGSKAEKLDF